MFQKQKIKLLKKKKLKYYELLDVFAALPLFHSLTHTYTLALQILTLQLYQHIEPYIIM